LQIKLPGFCPFRVFIYPNFRDEQRRLERLAREAAEQEAQRLKLLAEEERRIKAKEEAIKQAEIAAQKKERENELLEQANMSREDFDIGPDITASDPVPEELPDNEEITETPHTPPIVLTGARLKLYNIIKKLITSQVGQKNHPRKDENKQFFMPLAFGRDMRFDPFASDPHWEGPPDLDDEDEDSMPKTGYEDITKALSDKKVAIEKRKKNQLYQLNNPDVPSKDWTPMFRVDPVDWKEYFEEEFQQLKGKLDISASPSRTLKKSTESFPEKDESHSFLVQHFENVTYIAGSGQTLHPDQTKKELIPLPFGKVIRDIIQPGQDVFFQVPHPPPII
jgi:hypothetical protein